MPADTAVVPHPVFELHATVPVGVPTPGATTATVAVKVMDWPAAEGFRLEPTVVVVLSGLTTWLTSVPTLAVLLLSPE
jgi:hypothetical protein